MRIAMWSGPRNLSTAMMYSFGARTDCTVWDEPFYAAYLNATGLSHPMDDVVVKSGEPDPDKVISTCLGPIPDGKPHFYQKHMTHHMLNGFDRGWIASMKNVFLIRHPARVIASYAIKREGPTLEDIGFSQQIEMIKALDARGEDVVVVDSAAIRRNPEAMIKRLCAAIDLPFDAQMLKWRAGGHPNDGVWASHWYGAVHKSTGFAGAEGKLPELSDPYQNVLAQALPMYEDMLARAI
ncbi:MAG: HAD family hydrolase [Pseudoruegeria sp.]